ncbi:MAG: DUF1624 domain-containing protein [Nannocystaceae bacterium]|nr:DUF1624 domain-containing protein [Nannocystaceae bacterium]
MKDRILAVDYGRGASVVMMVLVHTMWIYGSPQAQFETGFGHFVHFVGRGTPMFLTAMGISFALSRRQSIALAAKRAVMLLLVGYGMNVLKFVLPILVGAMPPSFLAAYGWQAPLSVEQFVYLAMTGDILQLAGLSLLLMAVAHRFIRSWKLMFGLAIGLAFVSAPLAGLRTGHPALDPFVDLLWGLEWNVYFPVLPWSSVIVFGLALGIRIAKAGDVDHVFRDMLPMGLGLALVGGVLCGIDPDLHFRDFFHLGPGGALHLMGVSALLFWFSHTAGPWIASQRWGKAMVDLFLYCSPRVTGFYVIHWVLICWGMALLGYQQLGALRVGLLAPLVFIATYGLERVVATALARPASKPSTSKPQAEA